MKVLILKPKMLIKKDHIKAEYERIVKNVKENKITWIDPGMFDHEVVDIDDIECEKPKDPCEPYRFDNTSITFKFVKNAKDARGYLIHMIRIYGCVTIADFEKYVKHPVGCRDKMYGWKNLKEEDIKIIHIYKYDCMSCCYFDQFYLELPEPELID